MISRGTAPIRLEEWTDRLARFERSNQTVAEFCVDEHVSEGTFYLWKRRQASGDRTPMRRAAMAPQVQNRWQSRRFRWHASSGQMVGPIGMSDGTFDPLYPALRRAPLESSVDGHKPLSFIVEDSLIMLGDDRAVAAIKVLGQLSEKTHVVVFPTTSTFCGSLSMRSTAGVRVFTSSHR